MRDGPEELEYVMRRCTECGHADSPVDRDTDMLKNKCPKCNSIMLSRITDVPDRRLVVSDEQEV